MRFKRLMWIFALLVLCSPVYAATADDLNNAIVAYWKLEETALNYTDSGPNALHFLAGTIPERIAGIIDFGQDFDEGNSEDLNTADSGVFENNTFSVSLWFNLSAFTGVNHRFIIDQYFHDGNNNGYFCGLRKDGDAAARKIKCDGYNNAATTAYTSSVLNATKNYHFVLTWNGTNFQMYLNGTLNGTIGGGLGGGMSWSAGNHDFEIGASGGANTWDGMIDEVAYFNKALTQTEVTFLFNNGTPNSNQQYPFSAAGTQTDINITAVDDFNSSTINTFSVNVTWSNNGSTTTHSTSSGSIGLLNVSPSNITINVTYFGMTDYFNLTLFDQSITANTTNTVTGNVYQAVACFNSTRKVNEAGVTPNNYTIGSTTRSSCFNLTADSHNVLAQLTGWYDRNQTFSISALSNATYTVQNMSYANLTVFVVDVFTGDYLTGYDVDTSSVNTPSWQGENQTGVTNYSWYLINETYTFTVSLAGYASTNATKNISVDGHTNYTFYLREHNTLNITIYNETTNNLITGINISIDIIQPDQTSNLTTDNGTLYVTGLTSGEIEIRYEDVKSVTNGRIYIVTLLNQTYQEIRLYLLDDIESTWVTFDLVDQDGQDLEGAIVKAQRFYPDENLYRTVAMTRSNFNGESTLDLVQKSDTPNIFYQFIVEVDGDVKEQTEPTEILSTTLYFTIDVLADVFTSWDGMENVQYSLTYNNNTYQFAFTWSDTSGLTEYGCLKVTRHTPLQEFRICDSCTTSTAATIICNITDTGDLYNAVGLIETTTNSSLYTVATASWNFDNRWITFGTFGVFIALLFIMVMASVGLWNPVVAVVLTLVGLIFSVIIGLVNLTYVSLVTLVIIGLITVFRMRT